MTWLLTWLNESVSTLNATLQLLVIYRFINLHPLKFCRFFLFQIGGKTKTQTKKVTRQMLLCHILSHIYSWFRVK